MAVLCNAVKLMVTLNIHFRDTTSHLLLQLQQVAVNLTPGEPLYVSLIALLRIGMMVLPSCCGHHRPLGVQDANQGIIHYTDGY